ncbi:tetratricopeptide repeat protein [Pandoraea sp. PE-S2T-3]|uniref:tetratricopeptide repeat protein n=1 Tax=Pandoraea sp. PE-S2T-3 TaxID=1986993 RepID=UPI000B400636|nr:tetratricopeptide repeat protein [Pandoraea sp. PE-S2T-3]
MMRIEPAQIASLTPAQVRDILAGPPETAAAWLAAASQAGHVDAQVVYAQWLLDGRGVTRDAAAALEGFKRAAHAGHGMAANMAGRCYENGWGVPASDEVALYWYRQSARRDEPWGMYNLATLLSLGRGGPQDRGAALEWLQKAAAMGHAKSQNLLGGFHEDGWEVPRDIACAFDWYRKAAEGGDFRGQFNVARLLIGQGAFDQALAWLVHVPETATPAFLVKAAEFLSQAPDSRIRALAAQWTSASGSSASAPLGASAA